jgi:hypothetical protein
MAQALVRQLSTENPEFRTLLDRHGAFWRRDESSFLRVSTQYQPSLPVGLPQRDGSVITVAPLVTPDMVVPELLIEQAARVDLSAPGGINLLHSQYLAYVGQGDAPPQAHPFGKIPWLEAMLGCPITITEGQIWSERYAGDPREVIARGANLEHNAWLQLYLEFLRQMPSRLGDRFLVSANTLIRGACDLVAAVMGVQEAAIGWLEDQPFMARLLRVCTDSILAVVEAGYKVLAPTHGGYAASWDLWATAPVVATQADHSSLLSARIYEQQILPYDLEVASCCPLSIFHLHNNGLHVAPALMQRPEITVLEVAIDPYPTGKRKVWEIEMLQRIQQHKPLILNTAFPTLQPGSGQAYAESEWLLSQLDRRALLFNSRFAPDAAAHGAGDLREDMPGSNTWILGAA